MPPPVQHNHSWHVVHGVPARVCNGHDGNCHVRFCRAHQVQCIPCLCTALDHDRLDPLAHWVWGGGWTAQFGSIDFAGGTVVHISSGFAALALAIVIGKRVGYGKYAMEPANIPWSILGAVLLWFGWFGFNAGSAVAANGLAVNAFVTTNTATAVAAMAWLLVSWAHGGKPELTWVYQRGSHRACRHYTSGR